MNRKPLAIGLGISALALLWLTRVGAPIQVGEGGVYMVPGSLDERGCRQYSAWSAEAATPAVVYWRRTDGSFSMDPADADCPGEAR